MSKHIGLDDDPNSIFRASKDVVKIINKKLKKEEALKAKEQEATSDVGVTLPSQPSGVVGTNISKDLSSFSLQIKQLTSMIDSFVDYIDKDFDLSVNKKEEEKKEEEEEEEEQSYYDPLQRSVSTGVSEPSRRVIGSQINTAPVQEEEEEGEEDSDSDQSELTGTFEEVEFENKNGNKPKKYDVSFLSRELTRIANLTDVATANWEDNISPNIRSLTKNKISSFLKIIKEFEQSVEDFSELEDSSKIYFLFPELNRVFGYTLKDINKLLERVTSEVGIVSGISKGMMGSDPAIIRDLSVVKSDIVKITKLMHSFDEVEDINSLNKVIKQTNNAIIFWENNISPNVASLSKPDITKFLNSDFFTTFDEKLSILIDIESNFRHGERPELGRVLQFAIKKLEDFVQLIGVDVEKINSISGGRMTGAGYLHVPTAYNRGLDYSNTKYLM
jgi:hypothetical protein